MEILKKLTQAHPEEDSYREFLGDAHWEVYKARKEEAVKREAVESWRQLAPATTKDANRVGRVADILRAHDLSAEALEQYARAVELAPDTPELRQRWADYCYEQKRDEEGAEVMRGLVAGDRATAPNFLRLARWYAALPATPTRELFQAIVDGRGPGGIVLHDTIWTSAFRINEGQGPRHTGSVGFSWPGMPRMSTARRAAKA
ncbi:MAG: hypothetical protein QM813_15040 [Verrucomicrobiota bacterium]